MTQTKKKYSGISEFQTEKISKGIGWISERLPTILLVLGMLLRVCFLVVIIPELQHAFDKKAMTELPFFVVTVVLALLAESIFSVAGLAAPSFYTRQEMRKWFRLVTLISIIGLVYNGLEMYFFVEDYLAKLAHPENTAIKPHLFLQMCNGLAWACTELAGAMLIFAGMKEVQQEEQTQAVMIQAEATDLEEPAFFQKVDEHRYMVRWSEDGGIQNGDLTQAQNALNSARSRYESNKNPKSLKTVRKWESIIARMKYTPTPQGNGGTPEADITTGANFNFQAD